MVVEDMSLLQYGRTLRVATRKVVPVYYEGFTLLHNNRV